MIWFFVLVSAVSLALGYYVGSKIQQNKAKVFLTEALAELQEANDIKGAQVKQLEQDLADTKYQLSSLEKDYRYAREQLEK